MLQGELIYLFYLVGQEIRDRFSGAVGAFTRRNNSSSGLHADHSKNKSPEDAAALSKEGVRSFNDNILLGLVHTLSLNINCATA